MNKKDIKSFHQVKRLPGRQLGLQLPHQRAEAQQRLAVFLT